MIRDDEVAEIHPVILGAIALKLSRKIVIVVFLELRYFLNYSVFKCLCPSSTLTEVLAMR